MTIGDYLTAEARNKPLILAIVLGLLMVIRLFQVVLLIMMFWRQRK